tara:strand:- start:1877 stop:2113 length:237 start_codon:yes stop_codon:yes gene_type:complete
MTHKQYNTECDSIEYAVEAYMQIHPNLSDAKIAYDRQEDEWIVQITSSEKTFIQFNAKTAFELKAQILSDVFTAVVNN